MPKSSSISIPQIQKLQGATNFHAWRRIAKMFLIVMRIWNIVSGEKKKLSSTTEGEAWTQNSYWAQVFLLSNMDESLMPLIALAKDTRQAWMILEDKFDRQTVTNLHSLLKAIKFHLKCANKCEVSGHIAKYDELWQ